MFKTNCSVIVAEILRRKITMTAGEAGISPSSFTYLIRSERNVRPDTAGKLRAVFGADAVTINHVSKEAN